MLAASSNGKKGKKIRRSLSSCVIWILLIIPGVFRSAIKLYFKKFLIFFVLK
jgi:hypothetical protein